MEKTWRVGGIYGVWSMTLRLEDDDETVETNMGLPIDRRWPDEMFERLGHQFGYMARLREYMIDAEPESYTAGFGKRATGDPAA